MAKQMSEEQMKELHLHSAEILLCDLEGRTPQYVINLPRRTQLRRESAVGMNDEIVGERLLANRLSIRLQNPGHLRERKIQVQVVQ